MAIMSGRYDRHELQYLPGYLGRNVRNLAKLYGPGTQRLHRKVHSYLSVCYFVSVERTSTLANRCLVYSVLFSSYTTNDINTQR